MVGGQLVAEAGKKPPVWAWKRSACAFGFVAPKRSRMMSAQSALAARNLATSWKKSL